MRIMPGTRASISSAVPADSSGVPSIRVIIAPSFIFVLGACDFTTTSWRLSIYVMESFSCVWALAVIDADRAAMMAMVLMSVIGLLTLFAGFMMFVTLSPSLDSGAKLQPPFCICNSEGQKAMGLGYSILPFVTHPCRSSQKPLLGGRMAIVPSCLPLIAVACQPVLPDYVHQVFAS